MSDANLYLKTIPTNAQPTEALAARFSTWRKLIRALNVYFREVASVQEEVVRQNVRLGHAVNVPFFDNGTSDGSAAASLAAARAGHEDNGAPPRHHSSNDFPDHENLMFLTYGHGSIADVPGNIIAYHRAQAAAASRTSKELTQNIIPRLEDLRRDLLVKIKEIKNLAGDFRNNVAKEQQSTSSQYATYVKSIEALSSASSSATNFNSKHDPYLLKPVLDGQLRSQLREENFLLEAFLNIQNSGRELEKVVAQEVQQALSVFAKLMNIQGQNTLDLLGNKILNGYVSKDPDAEWTAFITRDPNFVDPTVTPRRVEDLSYQYQNSLMSRSVRSGYLERRSKYLKSYSRAWYVLTPCFLHEFKSSERNNDPHPVMSLSLDDCQLSQDTNKSSHSHKFVLNARQSGSSSHRGHNWVFRAESQEKMAEWFEDLSKLTAIKSPAARVKALYPEEIQAAATAAAATAAAAETSASHPAVSGLAADDTIADTASSKTKTSEIKYIPVVPPISSPVPSDTSGVTSNGDPFNEDSERLDAAPVVAAVPEDDEDDERPDRGRFPSEVNLEHEVDADKAVDEETLHREAAGFILPSDIHNTSGTAVDDQASVFSYDLKHTAATLPEDRDFKPVNSDIPVHMERRLTQTDHKNEDGLGIGTARGPDETGEDAEALLTRRRSSVVSRHRTPSRRATGSFGTSDELKPLSQAEPTDPSPLFFANGLPSTTSGAH